MWLLIATLCLVDLLWMAATGIALATSSILRIGAGVGCLGLIAYVYARRMPRIADLADVGAKTILFSAAAGILSYLAITLNAPLADAKFVAIDRALGFDWPAWFAWVQAHPVVHYTLLFAYNAVGPETILALILLPLSGKGEVVREFMWATMLSLLIIVPISGALPAVSAWVYFDTGLRSDWIGPVLALRAHAMPVLDLGAMTGLIACPSFHTALGIILMAVTRFNRRLLIGSIVLNGIMIVSVPSEGSHYVIDVLAGASVAAIALFMARRVALFQWSYGSFVGGMMGARRT